jgi:hypothetical protein
MKLNPPVTHTRTEYGPGNHILYKATFPNGKIYFGISRNSLVERIRGHYSAANYGQKSGKGFYAMQRALLKYPKSEVKWEVLFSNLHIDFAKSLEKSHIFIYYASAKERGYNTSSYEWSTEKRVKRTSRYKPFKAFDLLTKKEVGEWKCQTEAAEVLGLDQANIQRCLSGKTVAHGGYIFCHSDNVHKIESLYSRAQVNRNRPFEVHNSKGELVGTWDNSNTCANDLYLPNSREIRAVLTEPRRSTYKSYSFKYTEGK